MISNVKTEEMREKVTKLIRELADAKEILAHRLVEEFPARVGDILIHPRTGTFIVGRISGHYDGVTVYVHKKTLKGWDKRETTSLDLESGVLAGIVEVQHRRSAND